MNLKNKTKYNSLFLQCIITLTFIILLCLIIAIPQINLPGYVQSTVTSKFIVFSYVSLALLALYTLTILSSKIKSIPVSKVEIMLLLLFIYITVNRYVIQSHYGFSIRYFELIGLSMVYLVLRNLSFKNYPWLLLSVIISGVIQALYGNLQLLDYYPSNHSGFRLTGSFFNPGPYAGFLSAVWPIALGMYLFKDTFIDQILEQQKKNSPLLKQVVKYLFEYIPLLGVVSILLVIPASQSRAAWLSVAVSSLVLFELKYTFLKRSFKHWTHLKKGISITLLIAVFTTSLFGVYHFKKGSSDGRLFIWKVTTEIIKDNPVFGVGFDRFKTHYMNAQADYFAINGETAETLVADNTYYAFNEFVQFITENGLVGFVLLIVVLYFIIKMKAAKENDYLSVIIKVSLLTTGVFSFFSYPMQILPIKLVIVVLLASLTKLSVNKINSFEKTKTSFPEPILKVLVIGFLAVAVFSFNYIYKLDKSFKSWKLALSSYQYGDYESAIEEYEQAYPELKSNGDFLMNYGKTLSIYKQNKKAIEILEQAKLHLNTTIIETALGDAYKNLKKYDKAEIAYKHAANMIPSRFYPLYLLAKLYDSSDNNSKAIAMANTVLNKEVKIPSTAIEEIKEEMKTILLKYNKTPGLKSKY